MTEIRRGNPSKITGITPKLYIKDDGTDYDTGEEYNGLWSGGDISAPTGFGSIGHWKFDEEDGVMVFNNRYRGLNDLRTGPAGGIWSSDGVGKYFSFKLPGNEPLIGETNGDMYLMLGNGSSYNENSAWGDYLRHNPFEDILGIEDSGKANLRFMFSMWAYFRKPPQNDTDTQAFLELYDSASPSYGRVLTFCVRNDAGTLNLVLYYTDGIRSTRTTMYSCKSNDAATALFPGGMNEDGGLHSVGPEGFYVDGNYFERDSGNTTNWSTALQEIDCNAQIGCRFTSNTHTFGALKKTAGAPSFVKQFTGRIYDVSFSAIDDNNLGTKQRMQTLHGLKFDVPRAPATVDFSERFEYKGEDLLTAIGNIKQAYERDKGSFFITVQTIKAKN